MLTPPKPPGLAALGGGAAAPPASGASIAPALAFVLEWSCPPRTCLLIRPPAFDMPVPATLKADWKRGSVFMRVHRIARELRSATSDRELKREARTLEV